MKAGTLDHRIVLQDRSGGAWQTYAERWAGRELLAGQQVGGGRYGDVTERLTLRYLDGIVPRMRALVPIEKTTLNGAINNSVTTITVTSASVFPRRADFRIRIEDEILTVTAGHGTTSWTVSRGSDGTSAAAHADGVLLRRLAVHEVKAVLPVKGQRRELALLVHEAVLSEFDTQVTVRTVTPGAVDVELGTQAETTSDATVDGLLERFSSDEVGDDITVKDRKLTLIAADLSAHPETKDRILIDGDTYQIVVVDTDYARQDLTVYVLQIRKLI